MVCAYVCMRESVVERVRWCVRACVVVRVRVQLDWALVGPLVEVLEERTARNQQLTSMSATRTLSSSDPSSDPSVTRRARTPAHYGCVCVRV